MRETARIEIPEAKPAFEIIRGRLQQKMSPKRAHAELQVRWVIALRNWAGDRGDALTEWRFYFAPPGADWGSLAPDVGYLSREALDALTPGDAEEPPCAPEIAVEILSPDDRRKDVEWKIAAYLHGGTRLVVVADARRRTVIAYDGSGPREFGAGEVFSHDALPGFALALDALFAGVFRG